ncbi:unnamed protein product [Rhodiola kirilowii]
MTAACSSSSVFQQLPSSVFNFDHSFHFSHTPPSHRFNPNHRPASFVRCQSTNSTKETKTKRNLLDNASNLLTNFLSGGNLGSMPVAEGAVSDLFGRPLFFSLYDWFIEHGSVYKLAFGPKAFVVVSDPIGVLADILEPIMGKGLIPADLDTWKTKKTRTILKFENFLEANNMQGGKEIELDMEAEFSSLALDIIGLSVFNYDFGSVTKESPVIKAVYGTLFEAEHRSTFYIPYWKLPLAKWIDPCLLRFLVDMRGADVDDRQLRDDLMTMLIAGHETTAAVLTWAVFLLAQEGTRVTRMGLQSSQVPLFLDQPNEFEPERFLVKKSSPGIQGWAGYDPSRSPGALYPNEVISDFAFLPFGGGPRKCVGDQFALMESTVALAMLLQKFDVELRGSPESVELVTGATIHTKSGLWCKLRKRPQME